jgi:hypothetical protein
MITVPEQIQNTPIAIHQIKVWMLEFDKNQGEFAEHRWEGMAAYYWIVLRASGKSVDEAADVIFGVGVTGEQNEWRELTRRV